MERDMGRPLHANPDGAGGLGLEALLKRDRLITVTGLVALCLLAWVYLLSGAGTGMSLAGMTRLTLFPHRVAAVPAMPGMDGIASPAPRPGAGLWLLTAAMWWTMMIAMMAPAAAPAMLIYGRVYRHAAARAQAQALAPTGAFAAGYLLVWLGFSLLAAGLQFALQGSGAVSAATLGSASRWFSAAVLAAAGLYQLSPWQGVCLHHCRAPAGFLARHWRPGVGGAVRLGAGHGLYCVGCCWLLMALLFVGGVMNLAWIAGLTLLVLVEKILPGGRAVGRAAGAVLLAWALATAVV
jgi:predicted metal-binding membrane protein